MLICDNEVGQWTRYDIIDSHFTLGQAAGRSINLALSFRGIQALRRVNIDEEAMKIAIPMHGRMIHPQGKPNYVIPYGTKGEAINSIDRRKLNEMLLTVAENQPNVTLHFEHKLTRIDFDQMELTFSNPQSSEGVTVKHEFIFGCDGSYSTVRRQVMRVSRLNYQQEYIDHGYKELTMPATETGEYAMKPNYLHIWAKEEFMMIALPNKDCSFTVTLFMPYRIFRSIETEEDVLQFFRQNFPDSIPKIGEELLVQDFFKNPIGNFMSVKCAPHHLEGKCLLLGDAAHAMVPFYGQGMNCGFEDCLVFSELMDQFGGDCSKAAQEYSLKRVQDAHAICDLALYNYYEMRSHVNHPWFLLKKKIDNFFHFVMPRTFIPLYTMVAFTRLSYNQTVKWNAWQNRLVSRGLTFLGISTVALAAICLYKIWPKWLKIPHYSIRLIIEKL